MMDIRSMVLKEKELTEKIKFGIEELEMINGLMDIPKYKNSISLVEKFAKVKARVEALVEERSLLQIQIDVIEALL